MQMAAYPSVNRLPSTGHSRLFQKSNGHYELIVWNNVTNWNFSAGTPINISATNVTMVLSTSATTINVYDPTIQSTPISTTSGTSATAGLRVFWFYSSKWNWRHACDEWGASYAGVPYYMVGVSGSTSQLALTPNGTPINTSGSQSGTQTIITWDSSYQTYCRASYLALSPCLTNQEAANSILARWLQLTNTAAVWSGGKLKFIPYGDTLATGPVSYGYVTFSPNVTPIYNLTDDDFIHEDGKDPLEGGSLRSFCVLQPAATSN
jgi:hypothetical protein